MISDEQFQVFDPFGGAVRQKPRPSMFNYFGIRTDRSCHGRNAEGHILRRLHKKLALVPFVDRDGHHADLHLPQVRNFCFRPPRLRRVAYAGQVELSAADQMHVMLDARD